MISPRKQHAILVDAGYLFAQSIEDLFGPSVRRDGVRLDEQAAIDALKAQAASIYGPDSELLRVYWYDASPRESKVTDRHERLALHPNVKIRLGSLNSAGVQKGVDALICKDLLELSEHGAVSDILLVSGDEDLRVFVEMAQARGARVHILSVGPQRGSVSLQLEMESDGVHVFPSQSAKAFLSLGESGSAAKARKAPAKKAPAAPKSAPSKKSPAPQPKKARSGSAKKPAASPALSMPPKALEAPAAPQPPAPHQPDSARPKSSKRNRKHRGNGSHSNHHPNPQHSGSQPRPDAQKSSAPAGRERRRPRPRQDDPSRRPEKPQSDSQ